MEDNEAVENRRNVKPILISVLTAALLLSSLGVAFYVGRSTADKVATKPETKTAKSVQKIGAKGEAAFGTLPALGDITDAASSGPFLGSSAAREMLLGRGMQGASGAAAFPGAYLGSNFKYVWQVGNPALPTKAKVFKSRPGSIDKERAGEIAQKLGFASSPDSITIIHPGTPQESSSFDFVTGESTKNSAVFSVSSDGFYYAKLDEALAMPGKTSKTTPKGDDAIKVARAWLENKGLMPSGAVEGKVLTDPLELRTMGAPALGGAPEYQPPTMVSFSSTIKGTRIYQGQSIFSGEPILGVQVGPGGEITSASGQFINDLVSSEYPLRTVKEAFDGMAKGQGGFTDPPIMSLSGVDERPERFIAKAVELAYMRISSSQGESFLEPVYVFKGRLEGAKSRFDDREVIAPAVKGEFLKQRQGTTGSTGGVGGVSNAPGMAVEPDVANGANAAVPW